MKQIKAHIAVSLDGHIATPDHELDWIPQSVKSQIGKEIATGTPTEIKNNKEVIAAYLGEWFYVRSKKFICNI